jgi:hypothetical protein
MIAISHVIIGGTAALITGSLTQNPAAAFAVGAVSHLISDAIPHLDHPDAPKIGKDIVFTRKIIIFALLDSLLAFFITLFMWIEFFSFPDLSHVYIWGALGAYLPDFIDNVPWWRFKVRTIAGFKQFHYLHEAIHDLWNTKITMPEHWLIGTLTQVVIISACIWYLIAKLM